jgi:hypothetical protein
MRPRTEGVLCPQIWAIRRSLSKSPRAAKRFELLLEQWCVLQQKIDFLCSKSKSSLRSLVGHWKTRIETVDYGPCFRRLSDGSLRQESRTIARMRGRDTLLAKYPWMDLVDHQIFLEGFDAGEQYGRNISDWDNKTGEIEWA